MTVNQARKHFGLKITDTIYLDGVKDMEKRANAIISYCRGKDLVKEAWADLEACRALRAIAVY